MLNWHQRGPREQQLGSSSQACRTQQAGCVYCVGRPASAASIMPSSLTAAPWRPALQTAAAARGFRPARMQPVGRHVSREQGGSRCAARLRQKSAAALRKAPAKLQLAGSKQGALPAPLACVRVWKLRCLPTYTSRAPGCTICRISSAVGQKAEEGAQEGSAGAVQGCLARRAAPGSSDTGGTRAGSAARRYTTAAQHGRGGPLGCAPSTVPCVLGRVEAE